MRLTVLTPRSRDSEAVLSGKSAGLGPRRYGGVGPYTSGPPVEALAAPAYSSSLLL
jgi:hypothetical protein